MVFLFVKQKSRSLGEEFVEIVQCSLKRLLQRFVSDFDRRGVPILLTERDVIGLIDNVLHVRAGEPVRHFLDQRTQLQVVIACEAAEFELKDAL